jgi:adenosylcobinamide-GDP ribazoletransferase
LAAALVAAAGAACVALLAMRQIGGQTGDVLGGAEQVSEIAVLLLLATQFGERVLPL